MIEELKKVFFDREKFDKFVEENEITFEDFYYVLDWMWDYEEHQRGYRGATLCYQLKRLLYAARIPDINAYIDEDYEDKTTLLHLCKFYDDSYVYNLLLNYPGIDPTTLDGEGKTASEIESIHY